MSKPSISRIEYLENFAKTLEENFAGRNLRELSVEQAGVVGIEMPYRLKLLLKQIAQIRNQEKNEQRTQLTEEQIQKKEKEEKEISQEIFRIACASDLEIDKVLKFKDEAGLDKYEDLNGFDKEGKFNALAAAIAGGRDGEDLKALMEKGLDPNAPSPDGNNAAHYAVMYSAKAECLEALIAGGVNLSAQNNAGLTAFDMLIIKQAETGQESELAEVFQKHNARISMLEGVMDKEGDAKAAALMKKKMSKAAPKLAAKKPQKGGKGELDEGYESEGDEDEMSFFGARKNSKQNAATQAIFKDLGIEFDPNIDEREAMRLALIEAIKGNRQMATMQLLTLGVKVDNDVMKTAIDQKNIDVIGMVAMRAPRQVIIDTQIHASQVYAPAAQLLEEAAKHNFVAVKFSGAVNDAVAQREETLKNEKAKEEQQKQTAQNEQQAQEQNKIKAEEEEKENKVVKISVERERLKSVFEEFKEFLDEMKEVIQGEDDEELIESHEQQQSFKIDPKFFNKDGQVDFESLSKSIEQENWQVIDENGETLTGDALIEHIIKELQASGAREARDGEEFKPGGVSNADKIREEGQQAESGGRKM